MENLEKVLLEYEGDSEDEYEIESLWAKPMGNGVYELCNIPFLAKGYALGDIVQTQDRYGDGFRYAEALVTASGHSTVQILFENEDGIDRAATYLESMGCAWERSHISRLIAVDIPPEVKYDNVRKFLEEGAAKGAWDYQEACLAQGE